MGVAVVCNDLQAKNNILRGKHQLLRQSTDCPVVTVHGCHLKQKPKHRKRFVAQLIIHQLRLTNKSANALAQTYSLNGGISTVLGLSA